MNFQLHPTVSIYVYKITVSITLGLFLNVPLIYLKIYGVLMKNVSVKKDYQLLYN